MNMIPTTIKDNYLKIILGSVSSIIAVIAAMFALDARYAHAADVEKEKMQTQQLIIETAQQIRKQTLEDKLFELDIKKNTSPTRSLTPIDEALRERYQRQVNELIIRK